MNISTINDVLKKRKQVLALFLAIIVALSIVLGYLPGTYIFSNNRAAKHSADESTANQDAIALLAGSKEKFLNHNYQGALDDINKAIELKDGIAELYLLRGSIYASTKKYDLSIQDYTHALSTRCLIKQ